MQIKNPRVKEYVFNWLNSIEKVKPLAIANLSDEFIVSSIKKLFELDI